MAFPTYKPTGRSIKLPTFTVTKTRTVSGKVVRRIRGKYPSQGSMILEFGGEAGLLDAQAAEYYLDWKAERGIVGTVTLPNIVFEGMSSNLRNALGANPLNLEWRYSASPPTIEPTIPGRSKVTVVLELSLNSGLI
jgi:hypothetical protein